MAGRPKTMLVKVTALEAAAFELACNVCEARPKQYAAREGEEGDDELAFWWNRAARDVQVALIGLGELLGTLERKAGLGEEPERRRLAERGVVLEDATTAEGAST